VRLANVVRIAIATSVIFMLVVVVPLPSPIIEIVHADASEGTASAQQAMSAGESVTCVLTTSGTVRCWGENTKNQINDSTTDQFNNPTAADVSTNGQVQISVASGFTCALNSSNILKCWGSQLSGRLGNGKTDDINTGIAQTVSGAFSAFGAGEGHACAITTTGAVQCWGYPGSNIGSGAEGNRIGDGTRSAGADTPVQVTGLTSGFSLVTSGSKHSCALSTSGTVKCWGTNSQGQLGDNSTTNRNTPVDVSGISGATAITSGDEHTCALVSGGTVKCWGFNNNGQLGDGTTTRALTPVDVKDISGAAISGASAISAGVQYTCALIGNAVKCWGRNDFGQLGDGTTVNRSVPVTAVASGATAMTAGYFHTCALIGSDVKCWGRNNYGQLGDGTTTDRSTPMSVVAASGDSLPTFGSPLLTVTYDGNNQTSGTAPSDSTKYSSSGTVTVLGNTGTLAKSGYTFNGWCTTQPAAGAACTGTSRATGSTFTISVDTTLYAVWAAVPVAPVPDASETTTTTTTTTATTATTATTTTTTPTTTTPPLSTTTTSTVPRTFVTTTTTTPPSRPRLSVPGIVSPTKLTVLVPTQQTDSTEIIAEYLQSLEMKNQSQIADKLRDAVSAAAPAIRIAVADAVERLAKTLENNDSTQLEVIKAKAAVADASAQTILVALNASKGNVNSLALPVTKNSTLPELDPGKTTIITPKGTETGKVAVVAGSTLVLSSPKENISLAMTAIDASGNKVPVSDNNSVIVDHGQSLALTGSGFKPKSEVKIWIFSNPRSIGAVVTDAKGSFAAEVAIPDNLVPGDHTAQVNGSSKDGSLRSLNLGLEVDFPAQTPEGYTKTPPSARAASVFFRGNDSKMNWKTIQQLKKILPVLRKARSVTVLGYSHSDASQNSEAAIELSRRRAKNVAMWLRQHKIVVVSVTEYGYDKRTSKYRPALNRRVEIRWSD